MIAKLIGLLAASFAAGIWSGAAAEDPTVTEPKFPAAGTSYASARQLLFSQHLKVAPDAVATPDSHFPELDCSDRREWEGLCRALFIWESPNGWGNYVIVWVSRNDKLVSEARFPYPVEGYFRAIPPPEPDDVPKIPSQYLRARTVLKKLGFKPAPISISGATCLDRDCKQQMKLPEAICAVDAPYCNAYWIAPDGRALQAMTTGEFNGGRLYYETWITKEELDAAEK